MGTNYYHHTNICNCCNRYDRRHIGKSSGGWCFSLHVYPEEGILNLDDWIKQLSMGKIYNEYDQELSLDSLLYIIKREGVGWDRDDKTLSEEWLRGNHAQAGPRGMARHIIGQYCIGHGEGAWDYIIGEFS